MEILGRIKLIGQVQDVSQTFRKRELVVTTEEQYPQHLLIEFTQDKCELLNQFQIGEQVRVGINLRGREWVNPQGETRYFNSIQGWRIDRPQPQQGYGAPQQGYGMPQQGYGAAAPQQGQPNPFDNNQQGGGMANTGGFPPAPNFNQNNDDLEEDLPF